MASRLLLRALLVSLCGLVFGGLAVVSSTQPAAAVTNHRILITGDSITQGSAGDYTWRYRLWNKFQASSTDTATFVGPRSDLFNNVTGAQGSTAYADPFPGDNHAAKWGGSFFYDGADITSQVNASNPDVLVEMLGSNDLAFITNPAQTIDNVRTYVTRARAAKPGIDIVLCKVVSRYDFWAATYTLVNESNTYANLLESLAAELNTANERVVVANTNNGFDPQAMTWDGTHPNPTGEAVIANRVATALNSLGIGVSGTGTTNYGWNVNAPGVTVGSGPEEAYLSWQRNSTGATGMFIQQRLLSVGNPNRPWEASDELPWPVGADSWTSAGLAAGGQYQFRIRPTKGLMGGLAAGPATTKIIGTQPIGQITNLSVTPGRDSQGAVYADTHWAAANNATGYALAVKERVNMATNWDSLPYPVSQLTWTFTFLTPGHRYQFGITPVRGWAEGTREASSVKRMKGLPSGRAYVALGDSYSSGLGSTSPQETGSCLRSTQAWPWQLHPSFNSATKHLACAGDTTVGVTGQLAAMDTFFAANPGKPQLVTVTVGGNDIGFSDLVTLCLAFQCLYREPTVATEIDQVQTKLQTLYTSIKERQPFADVLVGGYPKLAEIYGGAVNVTCGLIDLTERAMIERLTEQLNSTISSAANNVGVWSASSYVMTRFHNHSVCDFNDPWIHGVNTEAGGEIGYVVDAKSFHPNGGGQFWYAVAFGDAIMDFSS